MNKVISALIDFTENGKGQIECQNRIGRKLVEGIRSKN